MKPTWRMLVFLVEALLIGWFFWQWFQPQPKVALPVRPGGSVNEGMKYDEVVAIWGPPNWLDASWEFAEGNASIFCLKGDRVSFLNFRPPAQTETSLKYRLHDLVCMICGVIAFIVAWILVPARPIGFRNIALTITAPIMYGLAGIMTVGLSWHYISPYIPWQWL